MKRGEEILKRLFTWNWFERDVVVGLYSPFSFSVALAVQSDEVPRVTPRRLILKLQ